MVLIIVIAVIFEDNLFLFLSMSGGPIRYTHILLCGFTSQNLAGNLPYYFDCYCTGKSHNFLLTCERTF